MKSLLLVLFSIVATSATNVDGEAVLRPHAVRISHRGQIASRLDAERSEENALTKRESSMLLVEDGSHDVATAEAAKLGEMKHVIRSDEPQAKESSSAHGNIVESISNRIQQAAKDVMLPILNIIQLVVALVFAYMYKMKVVEECPWVEGAKEAGERGKDFPKGLNDCWNDRHLCLHLSFCTICRSAHTWHVTKVLDYWIALFVQIFCCPCMPCIGGLYLRGKLRAHMGLEEDSLMDCVKYCFCEPCAMGQEAMMIDEESGVRVECCLQLQIGAAPLVTGNDAAASSQATAQASNEAVTEASNAQPNAEAQEEAQP